MDPDSRDDDRIDALRDRIAELETKVPDGPSRRQVLAGGGLLAAGGLLGGGASQQVSAQSAAGQIGTSSEPVDVEAASVNAGSVNADELLGIADEVVKSGDDPQTKVNDAPADGTVVFDSTSQFTLSSTLTVSTNGLSVYGANITAADSLSGEQLVKLSGDDVLFTQFEIDGNKTNVSIGSTSSIWVNDCQNTHVSRGVIRNAAQHGIRHGWTGGNGVSDCSVKRLFVDSPRGDGVSLDGGSGVGNENTTVEDIWVRNAESDSGAFEITDGVDGARVRNVSAINCGYGFDWQDHGDVGDENVNGLVDGVYVENCDIVMQSNTQGTRHTDFTLKNLYAVDSNGFNLNNTDGVTLENITIDDGAASGSLIVITDCSSVRVDGMDFPTANSNIGQALYLREDSLGSTVSTFFVHNVDGKNLSPSNATIRIGSNNGAIQDYIIKNNVASIQDNEGHADSIVKDNIIP